MWWSILYLFTTASSTGCESLIGIYFWKLCCVALAILTPRIWKGESFILLLEKTSAEKRNPSSFSNLKVSFKKCILLNTPLLYQVSIKWCLLFQANTLASKQPLYKTCNFCYQLYLIKWYCVHLPTYCGQKQQQVLISPAIENLLLAKQRTDFWIYLLLLTRKTWNMPWITSQHMTRAWHYIVWVLILIYDMQTPESHVKLNELLVLIPTSDLGYHSMRVGASRVLSMKSNLKGTMAPFTLSAGHM